MHKGTHEEADALKEQIRALTEKLKESNHELERFAQIASHDLQDPVHLLLNFTDLLKESGDDFSESSKQYIDAIADSAQHMHEMVKALLEYASTGHEHEGHEHFDAMARMTDVMDMLRAAVAHCHARIACDPLPRLYGNPMRFSALLANLLSNALTYRNPKAAPQIHISAEEKQAEWLFAVADNGIGIKPEYCDQIFEPFKRLHNREEYPGTGMGLAICRKIVKGWGGRIWVSSTPGKGSVFCFTLAKQPPATA